MQVLMDTRAICTHLACINATSVYSRTDRITRQRSPIRGPADIPIVQQNVRHLQISRRLAIELQVAPPGNDARGVGGCSSSGQGDGPKEGVISGHGIAQLERRNKMDKTRKKN